MSSEQVYELYGSPHLPTTDQRRYTGFVSRIRAHSMKQAYKLCVGRIWCTGEGRLGIIAEKRGKEEQYVHWTEREEADVTRQLELPGM